MKLAIAVIIGLCIGSACKYFGLSAPCPPTLEGVALIAATTIGWMLM